MSELRKDPLLDRWVIIAPGRGTRPREFTPDAEEDLDAAACPFCEGHERMTPPEVFAIRDNSEPDRPGWYVRVVPQKFPVLEGGGDPQLTCAGLHEHMPGIGVHEILIENPRHDQDLSFAPDEQIIRVIAACSQRMADLREDRRFCHVMVFRNHRRPAGARLAHPHTQIMALPIIPSMIQEQLLRAAAYHAEHHRCVFCDIIEAERSAGDRVILQTERFVAITPYASRFPYESTIYPLRHCHDAPSMTVEERADLATMLRRLLTAYRSGLFNPPYNLTYQTAPLNCPQMQRLPEAVSAAEQYHWRIEITPRLIPAAGHEVGTDLHVNPVAPEEAAQTLRDNLL